VKPLEKEPLATEGANALSLARAKGVRFWLDDGQLRYSGPRNALCQEEVSRLRALREQIIALLQTSDEAPLSGIGPASSPGLKRAPLAFSQLARWNLYELGSRKSRRDTAAVLLLRGNLSVGALQQSLREVIRRHEALRTRIVIIDSVPMQEVASSSECELEVVQLEPSREAPVADHLRNFLEGLISQPVDVSRDSLFAARLLRITSGEDVLIIATEHMISDAVSLNILIRDLFVAYGHIMSGDPVIWSTPAGSFADYAIQQRSTLPSRILEHHAWIGNVMEHGRLRFPSGSPSGGAGERWTCTTLRIHQELKIALQSWCRQHRTTLVMCIFTAYTAAILRWCNASEGVIQYRWDGRVSPRDEDAIGYFASMLYVLMEVEDDDTLLDLLQHAVHRYCDAYERADFSYLEAQSPAPEISLNPTFNWLPRGSESVLGIPGDAEATLTCCPMDFEATLAQYFDRDCEPITVLQETNEEVIAHLYFPPARFSRESMDRFGALFMTFVTACLERPETRVKDIAVP
jgi:hypothetical protein